MSEELFVSIPESIANLQLPNPELRNYYRDLDNRILYIDEQIDENLLEQGRQRYSC